MRFPHLPGGWLAPLASGALVAVACVGPEPVAPGQPGATLSTYDISSNSTAPSRHLVTLAGTEASDFEPSVQAMGGRVERRHPEIGVVLVDGLSASAAQALAARADVASVDADITLQWIPQPELVAQQVADDNPQAVAPQGTDQSGAQFFTSQWNLNVIQAPAAWHATAAGHGRLVCILDTGVDPDHIELAGRIALDKSTSFVASEPTIQDFNFHGTFVSSLVSTNGIRIASVASDAPLCAIKVLGTNGSGSFGAVIDGILFAANEGADVVNMSFGAYVDLNQPGVPQLVRALQKAVNYATRKGVVLVAAAGNADINLDEDPRSMRQIPAQLENVISVGATAPFNQQNFDMLASYSNFGGRTGIALVAPGGDLLAGGNVFDLVLGACSHTQVTLPFSCSKRGLVLGAGTSFASPHVAGAAAVVGSQFGDRTRPGRITECILEGADKVGPSRIFGGGRLNVSRAAACDEGEREGGRSVVAER